MRRIVARVVFYTCAAAVAFVVVTHPDAILRRLGLGGARTVNDVLEKHAGAVEAKYRSIVERSGISWPPPHITLRAYKKEKTLELWAASSPASPAALLATFPILAASGGPGPKLREGDKQVPEGTYRLSSLNPNSQFHLSIQVDYPNAEDIARSTIPRDQMGGDIFVHGGAASVGCLAIGDPAIEEVFTLVALANDRWIVIAPQRP